MNDPGVSSCQNAALVVERRAVQRVRCATSPLLWASVRPKFGAVTVLVEDISTRGIGLFCDGPIEPGNGLALLWTYGSQDNQRMVRAQVVRADGREGGWNVGCVFEEHLQSHDLQALVEHEQKIARAEAYERLGYVVEDRAADEEANKAPRDRRSWVRRPARHNIRARFRRLEVGLLGTDLPARLLDISIGGVQLVANQLLELRETLQIELEGHGTGRTIRRTGVVRWTVPINSCSCCAGVQFSAPLSLAAAQDLTRE